MAETNSKKKKKKFRLPGEFKGTRAEFNKKYKVKKKIPGEFPGTRAEFDKKYGTKFKLPGEFPGTRAEFEKKYGGTTGNKVKKNGNQVKLSLPKNDKKVKKPQPPAPKKKYTARDRIREENERIHGKSMQPLIDMNKDFQAAKKKKGGMDEFAKKYPKSQTAKERKRRLKITTWRDLE